MQGEYRGLSTAAAKASPPIEMTCGRVTYSKGNDVRGKIGDVMVNNEARSALIFGMSQGVHLLRHLDRCVA